MSIGSWSTFSFSGSNASRNDLKPVMVKLAFKADKDPQDPEKYHLTTVLKVSKFWLMDFYPKDIYPRDVYLQDFIRGTFTRGTFTRRIIYLPYIYH